jgi:hypothetical protein
MHAANLLKLADYLDRLPPDYAHFDMRTFGNGHPCKTSACAAGHGPAAGIPFPPDVGHLDWIDYIAAVFDVDHLGIEPSPEYMFMFYDDWDGDHYDAANRIRYALKHGVPDAFNHPSEKWQEIVNAEFPRPS